MNSFAFVIPLSHSDVYSLYRYFAGGASKAFIYSKARK
jgi:hypothetical protein